jgi:hypothetical protein
MNILSLRKYLQLFLCTALFSKFKPQNVSTAMLSGVLKLQLTDEQKYSVFQKELYNFESI